MMFQSIGKWLYNFLKPWLELSPQAPEPTEILPLTNEAYTLLWRELIAGLNAGWTKAQALEKLGIRRYDPWFRAWLRRYSRTLERSSLDQEEIATGIMKLGQMDCGDLSLMAAEIAQRIRQRQNNLVELSRSRCQLLVQQIASRLPLETESCTKPREESLERVAPVAVRAHPDRAPSESIGICPAAADAFEQAVRQYKTGELLGAIALWGEALEIQPNLPNAYNGRGSALYYLGRYDEAIADFTEAVKLAPHFHLAYNNRGNANSDLGNYQKALADYGRAIERKSDFYFAYNGRASVLNLLGHSLWAIADYTKAIELKPDFYFAYNGRGMARSDLGQYLEAIADFTQALIFRPSYYDAYNNRGNVWQCLGEYDRAIADYTQALSFNPNLHQACYSRGNAYRELGRNREAIADFTQALHIQPNYHPACNSRGLSYRSLGETEKAIADFQRALELKQDFWQAWANLGWTIFTAQGYQAALGVWNQGLETFSAATTDRKIGRRTLHYYQGQVHQHQAKQQGEPNLYRQAIQSYQQALKGLQDRPKLREPYLEVLQDLIAVYSITGDRPHAKKWGNIAIVLLEQLLLDTPTPAIKLKLARKFARLYQLEVDRLAQSLQPKHHIQALELAEERKALALHWLQNRDFANTLPSSPNYAEIQQLLDAKTGAISWHLSPVGLTAFLLKSKHPPLVLWKSTQGDSFTPSLSAWLQQWQEDCSWEGGTTPRYEQMSLRLQQLAAILDISQIHSYFLDGDIHQLILIPHQDLHLLPLKALFARPFAAQDFTISYLPSAQLGQKHPGSASAPASANLLPISLLAVEPREPRLPYQDLELLAIANNFSSCYLCNTQTGKASLLNALQTPGQIFHFSGKSYQDCYNPEQSTLCLDEQEGLSLPEILNFDFPAYSLVCLPVCETLFQGKPQPQNDFIGWAASFLAAGATHVLLSLWPVREFSTTLLVLRFYQQLQEGFSPADALNYCQHWLREVTLTELILFYKELANELQDDTNCSGEMLREAIACLRDRAAKMGSDYCPYAHPYYWAGFMLAGKSLPRNYRLEC